MSNEETKATEYLQHGTFNIKNYEQMIDREGNCLVRVTKNSEEYRSSVCKLRQSPPRKSAPPGADIWTPLERPGLWFTDWQGSHCWTCWKSAPLGSQGKLLEVAEPCWKGAGEARSEEAPGRRKLRCCRSQIVGKCTVQEADAGGLHAACCTGDSVRSRSPCGRYTEGAQETELQAWVGSGWRTGRWLPSSGCQLTKGLRALHVHCEYAVRKSRKKQNHQQH